MNVLAISTSTPRGMVAIARGPHVVARAAYEELRAHAEKIFGAIDDVLGRAKLSRADIAAVACDVGPGSFTGVRVGVAAANGVAFALGVPLFGVTCTEAMAHAGLAGAEAATEVLAVTDAQKNEVYVGRYRRSAAGRIELVGAVTPLSGPDAAAQMKRAGDEGVVVVGSAAAACGVAPDVRSDAADLPDAGVIAVVAVARLLSGDPGVSAARGLAPIYVREPDITLPG